MRVHEIATKTGLDKRKVVQIGKDLGLDVKNPMTNLSDDDANKIFEAIKSNNNKKQESKKPSPRVDVQKIEKKLQEEEKIKLEEERKQKEKQEKERQEREERQRKEKELNDKKLIESKNKEKTDNRPAQKRQNNKTENKEENKNNNNQRSRDNKSSSDNRNSRSRNRNFNKQVEPETIPVEYKDKKPNKKRRKNSSNEDRKYNDNIPSNNKFTRDLTKKTGNTVSKNKAQNRKEKKSDENKVYKVEFPTTVKDFANSVELTASEVIMKLMGMGVMATINENLDEDIVELLALEFGIEIETPEPEEQVPIEERYNLIEEDDEKDLKTRPPVVTVMGHVDHGKTSLLDKIRSASVQTGEAGGITQHIGAYTVRVNDDKITFLDTPGHEAFTMMRMRGAQVTDIAILVVAADDGVMPQTIEAISHAKAADVPIIVAINKMDKPEANPDRIKQELVEHDLVPEDWGGDTIVVPVSARTGDGIDNLLEMVLLLAEVQDLKANPDKNAVCSIIEAKLDKGKGPVASVLVQSGTLRVGDNVASGSTSGRIRAMINDKGKNVKKATPAMPVEIQGLSSVPNAGDLLYQFDDEKTARNFAAENEEAERNEQLNASRVSVDDIFNRIREGELKDFNIVLKADVKGSLEAVTQSLLKLSTDEVKINIVHSAVGGVSESDINLASASDAMIIGFNVRPNNASLELAKNEGVDIKTYTVIYKALEDIESAIKGMNAPEFVENYIGRAEVRDTFKLPNNSIIAGSYVISGKITRDSLVKILRDDVIIHEGEVSSLRRFKDDVKEVNSGYECGIGIDNFNDIKEGDIIEASIMEEVKNE